MQSTEGTEAGVEEEALMEKTDQKLVLEGREGLEQVVGKQRAIWVGGLTGPGIWQEAWQLAPWAAGREGGQPRPCP